MVRGITKIWRIFDQIIDQGSWQVGDKTISFAQFKFDRAGFLTSGKETNQYPRILDQHVGIGPKLLLGGSFANREYLFNEFRTPVQQEFQKATYLYHSLEDATGPLVGIRMGFDAVFGTLLAVLNIPIQLEAKKDGNKLVWRLKLPSNLEAIPKEMRYVRQSAVGQEDVIIPMRTGKREESYIKFSSSVKLLPDEEVREVMLLLAGKRVASTEMPRTEGKILDLEGIAEMVEAPLEGDIDTVQPNLRDARHRMKEAYDLLFQLENGLRQLIEQELKRYYGEADWWEKGATHSAKEESTRNQKDPKWKWHEAKQASPLNYVDFGTLHNIIVNKNWNIFNAILGPKDTFSANFKSLEVPRIVVAHSNILSQTEFYDFHRTVQKLLRIIAAKQEREPPPLGGG